MNPIVTCAGCLNKFDVATTNKYRKKRWCGNQECKLVIDDKVSHWNYKKRLKKIESGKYRNGVSQELRKFVLERDFYRCYLCGKVHNEDGYSKMQVHHIVPISCGGDDDLLNLSTLCQKCHIDVHQKGWKIYVATLKDRIPV